jgi:TRAP-type uncharacterized transport system substrate-binding protein
MKRGIFLACFVSLLILMFFASPCNAQQKKDWPVKGVTIGAAPIGGVYYVWAGGPAKVLGERWYPGIGRINRWPCA